MSEVVPIVSFPKSGNTWLRFLVANLFKKKREQVVNFKNINSYSCTSFNELSKINSSLLREDSPLFIKQHANYSDISNSDYKKVIYIYRNGFDVIKSYKHFTDAQHPGLYRNIKEFVKCYWTYCGHWGDHVKSWIHDVDMDIEIFSISYEDLKKDTFDTVKAMVEFLGFDFSDEHIKKAIEASSKDKMKSLSGSKEFMKSKKDDFHFVRSGTVGEGEYLHEEIKQIFLSHELNHKMMINLGYLSNDEIKRKYISENFYGRFQCKLLRYKYTFTSIVH